MSYTDPEAHRRYRTGEGIREGVDLRGTPKGPARRCDSRWLTTHWWCDPWLPDEFRELIDGEEAT